MFHISEEEYNSKLKKIKEKNESKKRAYLLKAEKEKIKKLTNPKMSTSNKVLISAIVAVISFTIACLYIQYVTSVEVSSTLITLWFSFWTVEIVSLAGIKMSKVFKENRTSSIDEDNEIYIEENEMEE